jgi:hypothetical protein
MDRRCSPISDLYGLPPDDSPTRRKGRAGRYFLLLIAAYFIFQSVQPVMRLRPNPPRSVAGADLGRGGLADGAQLRMARSCWDYAVASVQNVFPYGGDLPSNPPSPLVSIPTEPSAMGSQCWPRLRQAWTQPQSWVRSYRWSTEWITDPNGPVQGTISHALNWLGVRPR